MGYSPQLFDHVVSGVPRLNTTTHAMLMYGMVRWLGARSVVETGTWGGYCALWLARALEDQGGEGTVTCIDDWSLDGADPTGLHNAASRCGLAHRIRLQTGDSADQALWPDRVDFAFVDAVHSLDAAKSDVESALNRGARAVCLHDTRDWWGPSELLQALRENFCGVDSVESPHDAGLAILIPRRELAAPPVHTREDYPTGKV